MQSRDEQLVSLFRNIFTASGLVRFVRKNYGSQFARLTLKKGSELGQIRGIADKLFDRDLVDDRLFDKLLDADREHADLINRVRSEFVPQAAEESSPEPEASEEPAPSAISDDRRAWRQKLELSLDNFVSVLAPRPTAWINAAAVLPDFNPVKLHPYAGNEKPEGDLLALARYCDHRSDGRWELELPRRREALAALWDAGEMIEALDCNSHEQSLHANLLRALTEICPLPFEALANYRMLIAAVDVAEWLSDIDADLFNVDRVHAAIERFERIEPLRKLVGTHFRGRTEELATLSEHSLDQQSGPPILTLSGIGGAGKSTMLGKYLLDLDAGPELPRPWAYLDFDEPGVDPTDHALMMEKIARHIGLLYAGVEVGDQEQGLEQIFIGVESASSVDLRNAVEFVVDADDSKDLGALIGSLAAAIHNLPMEPSLLLVFDTFEQVQVRGHYAVSQVRELIDQILLAMPFARIVVSGRGKIAEWPDTRSLKIGDLDADSADQVLIALGVDNAQTRSIVIEQLGTNPLTLRLVADGISSGQISEEDLEHLVVGARSLELQGQLYTRILGHIQDSEVRRLAHPGLVVRRVSYGVIAEILADICDVDVSRIDRLLEKLPLHVALFEPDESMPNEGDALRHRQDVRETMLRLMAEDPVWRPYLGTIHDRAIEHYGKFDHPIARAEELYHRLMRNDDLEALDPLWSDDIAASLSRSWDEPLPYRARLWLGARIGRLDAESYDELRAADKEQVVAREVKSHLRSKDFEGALTLLESTNERTPDSPLFVLEARASAGLDRHDQSFGAATAGLAVLAEAKYPRRVMELHQLAATAALELSNFDAVKHHGHEAIRIAKALSDTNANLMMLDLQVRAKQKQGDAKDATVSAQALESVFVNADENELRNLPDVAEQVVRTLGAGSRNVLRKAALTFGNRQRQTVIDQDVFQLEKLLEEVRSTGSANIELAHLATQVGLPGTNYTTVDLAGAAIRYGRMGDALAVVLDHAGNHENIRRQTMSMFNLQKGSLL